MATTLLAAAVFLGACANGPAARSASGTLPPTAFVLDGRVLPDDGGEWAVLAGPAEAAAVVDGRSVRIAFEPPGEPDTLQAGTRTVEILLDTDRDDATGDGGHELSILLSPPRDDGSVGNGAAVRVWRPRAAGGGSWRDIPHAGVDLLFAPTYASPVTELRVDRALLDRATGSDGQRLAGVVRVRGGAHDGWSAAFLAEGPDLDPPPAPASIPAPAADAVRVVSWNILKSGPRANPAPFARTLRALRPDIVLVQEWDGADGAELAAWFTRELGGAWSAFAWPAHGTGIVSRYPLADTMPRPVEWEQGRDARFAWASVQTPMGEILAGSMHLKCCGTIDSDEDRRRIAEAAAIESELERVARQRTLAGIVVGGDLNLVGSRTPLDRLAAHGDLDGSDLTPVETPVLGDGSFYTWREDDNRFSPGRLDWLLYSDATLTAPASFAVDLRLLNAAAGLDAGDATISDHLPLVVDVRATK